MNQFNSALLSNTSLCEVSRLISGFEQDEFEISYLRRGQNNYNRIFDLITVIEALILNEKIYTLPSGGKYKKENLPLRNCLIEEGVVEELDTQNFHTEISELIIGFLSTIPNPSRVAGSAAMIGTPINFQGIETQIRNFFDMNEMPSEQGEARYSFRSNPKIHDTSELHHSGFPSEIIHLNSFEEMGKSLIGWIEYYGSGSYEHCTSILRDMYYIILSEILNIPYYPQTTRLEFSQKFPNYFDKNYKTKIYNNIAEGFSTTIKEVYEYSEQNVSFIPPFSSIVLNETNNKRDLIKTILQVRGEYKILRKNLKELDEQKIKAKNFGTLRSISRKQKELLDKASTIFNNKSRLSFQKSVKYIPELIKPITDPTNPTKYSSNLILQPLDWIRDWWLKRPVKKLFKLESRIDKIVEYENLLKKLFPETTSNMEWERFMKFKNRK